MPWPALAALGSSLLGSTAGGAATSAAGGAAKGGLGGAAQAGMQGVLGGSIGELGMQGMANLAQGSGLMGGGGFNPMQMAEGALQINAFNNKGGVPGALGQGQDAFVNAGLQNLLGQRRRAKHWGSQDASREGPFAPPSTFIA